MPRIDPHQLLKCLSVLLSPTGGVKSKDEVQRLANLMTKFSKKLVSKCIYVSILKSTDIVLLNMFMSSGGWDLTFSWLSDGVSTRNWPLVRELVELLLVCPVDIDRLKTNSCPKLIKTLSKDSTAEDYVRVLACRLVEQWLRIVRGDDVPILPSRIEEPLQSQESSCQSEDSIKPEDDSSSEKSQALAVNEPNATEGHLPVYKITIRDGKKVLTEVCSKVADDDSSTEASAVEDAEPASEEIEDDDDDDEDYVIKPVRLKKKPSATKGKRAAVNKKERGSTDGAAKQSPKVERGKKAKVTEQAKSKAEEKVKGKAAKNKVEDPKVKETSSKKVKGTEEAASTKHKDTSKLDLSLKNRKRLVTEKEHGKFDKLHVKDKSKEPTSIMDMDSLTDKEKETLSKFITPPISKLGKIPKKSSVSKEEKPLDDKNKSTKEGSDAKSEIKKHTDLKKEENSKKTIRSPVPEIKREKEKKWSIEPKRALPTDQKPKTAKIYSAKFRSTGLEEEVSKPPPRKDVKEHHKKEKPLLPSLSLSEKKPLKRHSPPPPDIYIPEKKLKPESPVTGEEKKHPEKPGIKLIPPKPRPMFLQESDVFMDAMLAANTLKEPRRRKRKGSLSKDHPEPKKDGSSPNHSPRSGSDDPNSSPSSVKPTFKFYQDTMDTSMEDDKSDERMEDENMEFAEPNDEMGDDQKSMSSEEDKSTVRRNSDGVKGVLVHLKSRKQKKSVSWKDDGLEAIRYFELDENERVNVTKNFTDMKNHEKEMEKEHFLIARKLAVDDVMEERTRWQPLIPIDMSVASAVVAAGKHSQEKEIQYAREKTVPAAIYFNRRMIPDAPAEPDLEIHATTDPIMIPLEDITGSIDSTNDFTTTPWPEPKGPPPVAPVPAPVLPPGPFPPQGGPGPGPFHPMPGPGPFMPGPPGPGMPMPGPPGGDWRTGDGNVVDMPPGPPGPPGMFPGPMMPPGMPMPPMMMPLMSIPNNMNPDDMPPGPPFHPGHPGPFPLMGPPGPGPFPGPPGPGPQGNWQGPPPNGPNWDQQGPHPSGGDRGGRFQGGGSWRGSRGNRNSKYSDNWNRGNSRREVPLCNKGQFCRNNNCRFRHPR